MSKDNVKELPGANLNATVAATEQLKRNMPEIIGMLPVIAEIRMKNYQAHLEKGFTEQQALELCKFLA